MPASETSATLLPACSAAISLGSGFPGIVLMIGDRALPDAVAVEQDAGDPRVLAGEDVGAGQRFQRAQRDVAEIADRRRHQIERRLDRAGGDLGLADEIGVVLLCQCRFPL